MYNKHSVGNFVHFVSIAGRLEALFVNAVSEFAGDLPNRWRSKMDKIAVNAFIHGGALSDPIELNSKFDS